MNKKSGGNRRGKKLTPFDKRALYGQGKGSGGNTGYDAFKPKKTAKRGAAGGKKGGKGGGGGG